MQPLKPSAIALDTDLPYGLAVVAYRLPGSESPDFAAGMILADVLDSQRGNLYALVPDGKALSAGFNGEALPKAGFGYAAAAFPQGSDGYTLVATIKEIIAGYVQGGRKQRLPPMSGGGSKYCCCDKLRLLRQVRTVSP